MDGSPIDYIIIPIVAIISLATWLAAIYWADSHPRTTTERPASLAEPDAVPTQPGTAPAPSQGNVPRQATAPADDAIPAQR
jgi:hypothetical protein